MATSGSIKDEAWMKYSVVAGGEDTEAASAGGAAQPSGKEKTLGRGVPALQTTALMWPIFCFHMVTVPSASRTLGDGPFGRRSCLSGPGLLQQGGGSIKMKATGGTEAVVVEFAGLLRAQEAEESVVWRGRCPPSL